MTSLFLLVAVSSVVFAVIALHRKSDGPERISDEPLNRAVIGLLIVLPICGFIFGYLRFDRWRDIIGTGILSLLVGIGLCFIVQLPSGQYTELTIITIFGTVGLVVFGIVYRVRHRG